MDRLCRQKIAGRDKNQIYSSLNLGWQRLIGWIKFQDSFVEKVCKNRLFSKRDLKIYRACQSMPPHVQVGSKE